MVARCHPIVLTCSRAGGSAGDDLTCYDVACDDMTRYDETCTVRQPSEVWATPRSSIP